MEALRDFPYKEAKLLKFKADVEGAVKDKLAEK